MRIFALMDACLSGPTKSLIRFVRHARQNGAPEIELRVVTFDRPSVPATEFLRGLEDAGIPCHVLSEKRRGDRSLVRQLRELIDVHKPDIVQTHTSKSHVLMRRLHSRNGARWVAFHHGFPSATFMDQLQNLVARWALRGAPHVITVCHAYAHELHRAGVPKSRISVMHNAVEPFHAPSAPELAELRERLALWDGTRIILTMGRLAPEKGHADFMEALRLVRERHPRLPLRVLVVGDGPERAALEQQASDLGVAHDVVFLGYQHHVQPFYAIADVLVLASYSEGSSNVLLEAMAAGVAIVATAVGGSVELLQDGTTAVLTQAGDPEQLADALEQVLMNPALAHELRANARVHSFNFGAPEYARRLTAIYRRLLAG
jgi:glycosyltransferase involved in cell wall biosynthesis